MYAQGQPIIILKEGTRRETGRGAQANNIEAARTIANVVKSTLGPRGMDKMLVVAMGDVVITNDGATILKEIDVAHPAAKMIIEVAKTQDNECGDGTKSAVILAGELLRVAQELLEQHIHATVITRGFRLANQKAQEILAGMSRPVTPEDTKLLVHVATTALASKIASANSELLSRVAIDACRAVADTRDGKTECDIDNIQVQKSVGGSVGDSRLIQGVLLDKERVHDAMPHRVKNAKIALADLAFEVKKTEVEAKIEIREPQQLEGFLAQEEHYIRVLVDKVIKSGANVLVCQKGIDDLAQSYLSKAGIYAVRRAKQSDMEKLAKATGARVVSTLDDLNPKALGAAGEVYEEKLGDDKFTFVTGCKDPKAVSILLRGGTEHFVEELERALHDTLSVVAVALEDLKVIPGGGAFHVEAALGLRDYATTMGGREQMAIEAFAEAIEVIPRTLAENAGLDEIDILISLRQAHKKGQKNAGVNAYNGKVEDMVAAHVIEPLRVGRQALNSATEAATMILRIDDVIASKSGGGPAAPPGPGGGGMQDFGMG
ncbi:MAG: TCP-1/cpn60 chaperonin family protein [Euryarchaeota archaeon]|nr:TCP-1/cpn60 chaperonin family protein [Euryarchaeota archaeon]